MARELKMFFVGLGLVVGGVFVLGVTYFITPATIPPDFRLLFFTFFVSGVMWLIAATIVFLSESTCSLDTFFLALRWRFIVKRPFREFPLGVKEREALCGWAEEVLGEVANQATDRFFTRDQAKRELSKLESETHTHRTVQTPSDLPKTRKKHQGEVQECVACKKEQIATFSKNANLAWKHFLKLFDLFDNLAMLPTNPATQTVWSSPNDFRLYVQTKENTLFANLSRTNKPTEQTTAPTQPTT